VAKDAQGRVGKQLQEAKGPSLGEDDDAVRTSLSQDRVTETLCTEELFLSIILSIDSSPHISERSTMRGGEDADS
jgi:hypothetical protein